MIKKFETFFGGVNVKSPGSNFNSSVTKPIDPNPDEISQPIKTSNRINDLKEDLCLDIIESHLDLNDLRQLKNLLNSLR